MPFFGSVLVLRPGVDIPARNLKDSGQVFSDAAGTQPLTVYVGDNRAAKAAISTGDNGISESFSTDAATVVYVRWPGFPAPQEMWSRDAAKLLNDTSSAVAKANAAQVAAEKAAADAAAVKQLSFNAQNLFGSNNYIRPELIDPSLVGSAGGSVTSGSDPTGTWIQVGTAAGGTARLYPATKQDITAAVAGAGSTTPQGDSLAKRDADGRLQVASPASDADAATKGYADGTAAAKAAAAVAGAPLRVFYSTADSKWHYGSMTGQVVTSSNRPTGRVIDWFFGPDPATVSTVKVADGDTYYEQVA